MTIEQEIKKLEEAKAEVDRIFEYWKRTTLPEARRCHEQVIGYVINSYKQSLRDRIEEYWRGLKGKNS